MVYRMPDELTTGPGAEANTGDQDQTADHRTSDPSVLAAGGTAIATLVLAIVALFALPGIRLQAIVVLLAFVLPLVLGLLVAAIWKKRRWPIGGLLLIGLFAGLFAIAGFGWWDSYQNHHVAGAATKPTPGHSLRSSSTPLPAASSGIRFLDPQPGDLVKQCPRIDGAGVIPQGYGLWIIVVPNTNMVPKMYWIESQAKSDGPDHWTATDSVSIDKPSTTGINADIYAVLIDKKWSDYFAVSSANGNFSATSLPPSSVGGGFGPVTVTRVSGAGSCH